MDMIITGSEIRYRLKPFAFIAMISLFFERELKVMSEASKTDAGIVWEAIIGII
jgi:hypothetical protein